MAEQVPYEELMRQLTAVGVVRRDLARILPHECPAGSVGVLIALKTHGDLRMSKLTELLSVDMSVTSRHVAHVAERGWVERLPDPDDKRSRILHLTDAGRDAITVLSRRTAARLAERLSDWDEADVRRLTQLMARLRDSFDDARASTDPPHSPQHELTPTPANATS